MEIELVCRHGYNLVVKADNVHIDEDVEERQYIYKEDGKLDISKGPKRDVKESAVRMIAQVMEDMIYYREKEIDTSDLIERLFEKLPENVASELSKKLFKSYCDE